MSRECWICYQSEKETVGSLWVHPCTCRGGLKWCHQTCLLGWIDEKQKGNSGKPVRCPQCLTDYVIVYPTPGPLLAAGEFIDRAVAVTFPYIALSGVLYCGYVSCVTYGFYAVVQMMGHEESERLLHQSPRWGWRLFVGLPMIPVALVTSRFHVFDIILPLVPLVILPKGSLQLTWPPSPSAIVTLLPWARVAYTVFHRLLCRWLESRVTPGVQYLAPGNEQQQQQQQAGENRPGAPEQQAPGDDRAVLSLDSRTYTHPVRAVVGALLLPAVSSTAGSLLFGSLIKNTFHRNVLGGIIFVVTQDILSLFFHYFRHKRQSQRIIRDFSAESDPK